MRDPYLLSGEVTASYPPSAQSSRPSGMLRPLLIVWLLAGSGFALWKFGWSPKVGESASTPSSARVVALGSEDLAHHLETLNSSLGEAEARLRHADEEIARSLPAIERNDLYSEKRHLQSALAAHAALRRDLEQARQQSDLVLNSLKEKLTQ